MYCLICEYIVITSGDRVVTGVPFVSGSINDIHYVASYFGSSITQLENALSSLLPMTANRCRSRLL